MDRSDAITHSLVVLITLCVAILPSAYIHGMSTTVWTYIAGALAIIVISWTAVALSRRTAK